MSRHDEVRFAQLVADYRARRIRATAAECSAQFGVSPAAFSRWGSGIEVPADRRAAAIAKVMARAGMEVTEDIVLRSFAAARIARFREAAPPTADERRRLRELESQVAELTRRLEDMGSPANKRGARAPR